MMKFFRKLASFYMNSYYLPVAILLLSVILPLLFVACPYATGILFGGGVLWGVAFAAFILLSLLGVLVAAISNLFKKKWLKSGINFFVLVIFTIAIYMMLVPHSSLPTKEEGESTFKEFIAPSIPKGVYIEEGRAAGFQGYYAYIIFTAEPDIFKELVKEYELLPSCRLKTTAYENGKPVDNFQDVRNWLGEHLKPIVLSMKKPKCYYRKNIGENAKGIKGTFYMFYDEETHKAVFEGSF